MKKIFTKTSIYYLLSFLIPLTIISIVLAFQGIWWGSDTTILASDGFHQYVIFNQTLRNTLHGDGSLFYTFSSGLGLNFYALSSYYLGSFLSPIVFFFDLQSMPDAIYLVTIVKFGLTGLSTYFSLKGIHKNLKEEWALLLATSFSLMSFSTSQLEINNWLDVFILLPLVLLGLHRLLKKQGPILYYITLTCLFIQNYYFGYMVAIFLTLWTLVQLSWIDSQRIKRFINFTIVSILSALSSMFMLLPTYLDLKTHGETFTKIVNLKTEDSWYLDFFAKNLVGSFDTTKFGSIPMISVGLVPLILALLFFTLKEIKPTVKLSYALFFTFIISSFYLQPLNLFWQGMHAPNMFLYRYAWALSITVIYLAAETLVRLRQISIKNFTLIVSFLLICFTSTFIFRDHYEFLTDVNFLLTLEFLIAYFILFVAMIRYKSSLKWINIVLLFFTFLELGLHSHYQVQGISDEWHFPSRSNYEEKLTDIDSIVKSTKTTTDSFYRIERLLPQTGNDSMKFNYNGISQFSSIRNRASSSVLDKLGFRSDGTNLNLRYQNNTIIADSLFGVKYNLATTDPNKFGFTLNQSQSTINLYENSFNLGLALLTEGIYKDVNFTNLTLDNQTNFLNQLTGLSQKYYHTLSDVVSQNTVELSNRMTVNKVDNEDAAKATFLVNIPANSQVYLNLPNLTFSNENQKKVVITVNNQSSEFTLDNAFSFFNVGSFTTDVQVQVNVYFPENNQVSFDKPQFYRLDLLAFQQAISILQEKQVVTKTDGNKVTVDFVTDKESSLLLTLPYDKGWNATIDGKPIKIQKAQDGFMKVDVSPGQTKLVLTFVPNGFYLGLLISFGAVFVFFSYQFIGYYYSKNREY
ncbi:membrane protein [Streptococcus suis]|uniref:YfhO family protein n=1 Tax=Streptococcus suis TaxID=1307 RepID=UPI0005D16516|nr:YfhO family protein [Streptococcus suis]CYY50428.1 membrane protein [Streptococcus suis]